MSDTYLNGPKEAMMRGEAKEADGVRGVESYGFREGAYAYVHVRTVVRYLNGGTPTTGEAFVVKTTADLSEFGTSFLYADRSVAAFVPAAPYRLDAKTVVKAVGEAAGKPAHGGWDVPLEPYAIAYRLVGKTGVGPADDAAMAKIAASVGSFLGRNLDPRVAGLSAAAGRALTAKEYSALLAAAAGKGPTALTDLVQACAAYPVLIPWFASATASAVARKVFAAVFAREPLAPVIEKAFGCGSPSVARALAALPAPLPEPGRGTSGACSPVSLAAILAATVPERRPSGSAARGDASLLMRCAAFVERVLEEFADSPPDPRLLAAAVPAVVAHMRRRPYELPDADRLEFLGRSARCAAEEAGGPVAVGTLAGERRALPTKAFFVVWMLRKFHPLTLVETGRKIRRKETAYVREALPGLFPDGQPIPVHYPETFEQGKYAFRALATVGDLARQAAAAENCLCDLLPYYARRRAYPYAAFEDGVLAGHVEIGAASSGDGAGPAISQIAALKNRKAPRAMAAAAEAMLEDFVRRFGPEFPPEVGVGDGEEFEFALRAGETVAGLADRKLRAEIGPWIAKAFAEFSVEVPGKGRGEGEW